MSLRVGDLLWMGDVLPSTREICSIRQGSCFNKYPANVSHPPPTRTMTCLLCSIWNERKAKVLNSENSYSILNRLSVIVLLLFFVSFSCPGVFLLGAQCLSEHSVYTSSFVFFHATGSRVYILEPSFTLLWNQGPWTIPCLVQCVWRLLSDTWHCYRLISTPISCLLPHILPTKLFPSETGLTRPQKCLLLAIMSTQIFDTK